MTLGKVHTRILIAGAWLLGTAGATGGCLWATAHLGQGLLGAPGQQLSVAAVNRALASEAAETPAAEAPASAQAPDPSASPMGTAGRAGRRAGATGPAAASAQGGTLLTSRGGNVVAGCPAAGAYLASWSPQQGYEAVSVRRGPAAQARVIFRSSQFVVGMVVTCRGGVPSAATSVQQGWHGDE